MCQEKTSQGQLELIVEDILYMDILGKAILGIYKFVETSCSQNATPNPSGGLYAPLQ